MSAGQAVAVAGSIAVDVDGRTLDAADAADGSTADCTDHATVDHAIVDGIVVDSRVL